MRSNNELTEYTVTRQAYYYSGQLTVEVVVGSLDNAGADMLADNKDFQRLGSGETFDSLEDAFKAAIAIRDLWLKEWEYKERHGRNNDAEPPVIGYGNSWGGSLEIEPTEYTDAELLAKGKEADALRPTCDRCGEVRRETYRAIGEYGEELTDEEFCSEYCADEAAQFIYEQWLEDDREQVLADEPSMLAYVQAHMNNWSDTDPLGILDKIPAHIREQAEQEDDTPTS